MSNVAKVFDVAAGSEPFGNHAQAQLAAFDHSQGWIAILRHDSAARRQRDVADHDRHRPRLQDFLFRFAKLRRIDLRRFGEPIGLEILFGGVLHPLDPRAADSQSREDIRLRAAILRSSAGQICVIADLDIAGVRDAFGAVRRDSSGAEVMTHRTWVSTHDGGTTNGRLDISPLRRRPQVVDGVSRRQGIPLRPDLAASRHALGRDRGGPADRDNNSGPCRSRLSQGHWRKGDHRPGCGSNRAHRHQKTTFHQSLSLSARRAETHRAFRLC